MMYQLTKDGAEWNIEISGAVNEETQVKSFASREEAEDWRRKVSQGVLEAPVLSPLVEVTKPATKKPAAKKPAPAKKA